MFRGKKARADRFLRLVCLESYYEFFKEFWPLTAAEPLHDAWYIRKLCEELQALSERVFLGRAKEYDLVYNCPPTTTKSSCVSVLWQPWLWARMPSLRFISGSHSERLALDLSRKSRDVVTSAKYRSLFPEIALRDDQNTKGYFANTLGGMRYATGVGGSVIGMHAHVIAIDDPIDPQAALSDLILAEANTWMNETLSRRKVNVMLTPTVLIMQRLHQDDPSGNMLGRGTSVRHVCLPCDNSWEVEPPSLLEYYSEDGLLDPVRLPQEGLEEARRTLGDVAFAGQYGQKPVPRGGAKFKVELIGKSPVAPERFKYGPVRFWDTAGSQGKGNYTAGVKGAIDFSERLWVLDVVRGQWDSGRRERVIDETARADGPGVRVGTEQEPADAGKEVAERRVRRLTLLGFRAYAEAARGDKELRADPFSQWVNQGRVMLLEGPWNAEYLKELRYFPRSKYKDQTDASGGMFKGLTKPRLKVGVF